MAQMMMMPSASKKRKPRTPRHNFNLVTRPWQIQPFMLAPVLPGETMDAALLQSRVVTDPLANPLIGWWKEYYLFYVKHRDLVGRDDFTEMMLDPNKDLSSYESATDVKYNHHAGSINWAQLCLVRVVEEFFRNEGEAWDEATLDGMPLASVSVDNWLMSVISGDNFVSNDFDADLNADDTYTASEIAKAQNMWLLQRSANMTDMSYEDFLRTYGVQVPDVEEAHRPELIRYVRDWTYPTNTIDPSSGTPSSACSWSVAERADKDRYFKEPGFIFGVTVCRPKIYYRNIDGNMADWMNSAMRWVPAIMWDDPQTSLHQFANDDGPLQTVFTDTGGYWIDIKDLFLYGDQFFNYDQAAVADRNFVDLPASDLSRRYADGDDADGMFLGEDATIREDGVVSLNIRSRMEDTSPGSPLPGVTA